LANIYNDSCPHYSPYDYHKGDQWLMDVFDVDKDAPRTYAMTDILEFIKE